MRILRVAFLCVVPLLNGCSEDPAAGYDFCDSKTPYRHRIYVPGHDEIDDYDFRRALRTHGEKVLSELRPAFLEATHDHLPDIDIKVHFGEFCSQSNGCQSDAVKGFLQHAKEGGFDMDEVFFTFETRDNRQACDFF